MNKLVIIKDIEHKYISVLIQRLVSRINRLIKPDLLLIISDDENTAYSTILNTLNIPYSFYKKIEDSGFKNLYSIDIPSLCSEAFPYLVVTDLELNKFHSETLAMDKQLELIDRHIHTELAYCNDNMEIEKSIELGKMFGLKSIIFTEHTNQMYFSDKEYNTEIGYIEGISVASPKNRRMDQYIEMKNKYSSDFVEFGLEIDCDYNGIFQLDKIDQKEFSFKLGSMHQLKENTKDFFLELLEKFLKNDIDVLAHPFRIFKRTNTPFPEDIIGPTVRLLKEYNTAAEINFHTNYPSVELVKECIKEGVKLSFGSDSHTLAEIGDFSYHLDLLKQAGFKGELSSILYTK